MVDRDSLGDGYHGCGGDCGHPGLVAVVRSQAWGEGADITFYCDDESRVYQPTPEEVAETSVEVPLSDVRLGDEVWLYDAVYGKWESLPVVGFGQPSGNRIAVEVDVPNDRKKVVYPDLPYVAKRDHDGDFSWNCNNYVHGDTARIKPRGQQIAA